MNLHPKSLFRPAFILAIVLFVAATQLQAQQTSISDYVLFGGKQAAGQTTPTAPGYGVLIGASCNLQALVLGGGMGSVGSYNLVKSTGALAVNGNIYSGGTIQLAGSNTVKGNLAAGLSPTGVPGTVISIGTSAVIGVSGDLAKGNIKKKRKITA